MDNYGNFDNNADKSYQQTGKTYDLILKIYQF